MAALIAIATSRPSFRVIEERAPALAFDVGSKIERPRG
jgi:hypothetical protein